MIAGGLFVMLAIDAGFVRSWIMLFNLVLATYLAVFLTPQAAAAVPSAAGTPMGYAFTFLAIGGGVFAVGYGLTVLCLASDKRIEFPRALETLGAGFLGFVSGFLVCSFFAVALLLTPWSQSDFCRNWGLDKSSLESNTQYVSFWCERINTLAAAGGTPRSAEDAVRELFRPAGPAAPSADSQPTAQTRPRGGPSVKEIERQHASSETPDR